MSKLSKVKEEEVKVEKVKEEKVKAGKAKVDEVKVDEVKVDKVPEVTIDVTKEREKEPDIKIEVPKIDKKDLPEKDVRIRALVDHKCNIGGEVYDLKKGQCYNVPESVRKRLNKVGLLAPL